MTVRVSSTDHRLGGSFILGLPYVLVSLSPFSCTMFLDVFHYSYIGYFTLRVPLSLFLAAHFHAACLLALFTFAPLSLSVLFASFVAFIVSKCRVTDTSHSDDMICDRKCTCTNLANGLNC